MNKVTNTQQDKSTPTEPKEVKIPEGLYTIPQYPLFSVTKTGKVFSLVKMQFLPEFKMTNGYMGVSVRKLVRGTNGSGPRMMNVIEMVHRLVLHTFADLPYKGGHGPDSLIGHHIDGDPHNNNLENLEVCTMRENSIARGNSDNNKSGCPNVCWVGGRKNHYQVYVASRGENHYGGCHKHFKDAVAARNALVEQHHEGRGTIYPLDTECLQGRDSKGWVKA